MPYIESEKRKKLDHHIDNLAVAIGNNTQKNEDFSGVLNYCITRLIVKSIKLKFNEVRYWIINAVTGTLKNVNDEFYRRIASPYEDKKCDENGEVYDELMEK
jgi:hypothetical protein